MINCFKAMGAGLMRTTRLTHSAVRQYPRYFFSNSPRDPLNNNTGRSEADQTPQEKLNKLLEQEEHESKRDSSSTGYILAGGSIVIAMAYVMMNLNVMRGENKENKFKSKKVEAIGKADIGGDWQLKDTKGNVVKSSDLKGSYYLIYFGFCNCPDICPNSLNKLKRALDHIRKTPESKFFKIKSVFVSVDPDRDTPQKIDKFLSYFDPQMIGVTASHNNDPALKDILKKFKIYASKIQYEQEDEKTAQSIKSYTIDHTILTYLMDDQNQYLAHLGANLGEHDLARTILEKITNNEKLKLKQYKL